MTTPTTGSAVDVLAAMDDAARFADGGSAPLNGGEMREARAAQSAAIARVCFLACALIPPLAYLSSHFRHVGPVMRQAIHSFAGVPL